MGGCIPGAALHRGLAQSLWAETGYVLEMRIRSADGGVNVYMFESGGTRYELQCAGTFSVSDAWDAIAGSVEALESDGGSDLERHEVPEAGIAISFSPEWLVETGSDELDGTLPPEYGDAATVPVIRVLTASLAGEAYCAAYYFDEHPLSTAEHADWYDSVASDNRAATEIELVSLPVGDAARVIEEHETGDVVATYLFDLDGVRHQLACASGSPPDDLWRSVAETIEPLGVEPLEEVPPGVPDEAVAWDEVVDFWTQVPVADPAEDAWLMSAWCDRALWIELPDGSFTEQLECRLTEDPVEPAEWQGSWPADTVTLAGGACEWASDFWAEYDGSEIWASSWSALVEPDGQVVAVLTYAPELLECADG